MPINFQTERVRPTCAAAPEDCRLQAAVFWRDFDNDHRLRQCLASRPPARCVIDERDVS